MPFSRQPRFAGDPDHLARLLDALHSADIGPWNSWRAAYDAPVHLEGVDLPNASLVGVNFFRAHLERSNLAKARLQRAALTYAHLDDALLEDAELFDADLTEAQLPGAQARRVLLRHADITAANFSRARLARANLELTDGEDAIFDDARMAGASFRDARLPFSAFERAQLDDVSFHNANLQGCNMRGATLTRADLTGTRMSGARLQGATLRDCLIYGLSAWDVEIDDSTVQQRLVASAPRLPETEASLVRVDDIEIAQFINLIMRHARMRKVISAAVRKCVLLLGRFRADRRPVLDALADCLRAHQMIPVVFDFPRPEERDLVETVTILASLSSFIIADITAPRSVPHEAQAIVPNFMVPFVPVLQSGEDPFPTFAALELRHRLWVLPRVVYDSVDTLRETFEDLILARALEKERELRALRAAEPESIDARAYRMRLEPPDANALSG